MPDGQQPFQPAKGGYGAGTRQQGYTAQERAEMTLRPRDAENVQYPRAGDQAKPAIANPFGGQALHAPEMLQRGPVYEDWDDTEFLPFRMRDSPPRPADPSTAAPFGAQRYPSQVPVAQQQHLRDEINPHSRNPFMAAVDASKPTPEIVRTGFETYNIVSTLQEAEPGNGGMSEGVFVVRGSGEKLFVAKRLSTASETKRARAAAEAQALQQVKSALRGPHPNVNSIKEAFLPGNAQQGVLILEYCEAGSLQAGIDAYKARNVNLDRNLAFHFLYGIAKGLAMIHHGVPDHTNMHKRIEKWNAICHLDIKPANILIDRTPIPGKDTSTYPRVVIADFGCSVTSSDIVNGREGKIVQEFGTPGWYPPEGPAHISGKDAGRYGKVTDIWQAGGVIQCMCLLLFQPDMGRMDMPVGRNYGPELNCIVAMCMSANFRRRPTAIDLCRELRAVMVRKGIPI